MPTPFEVYLGKIEADFKHGKATEHTYRSSLKWLLESSASDVNASNDPKHIACGAPDFIVERRNVPLGYVETKDVGVDLDKIEKSDQLKRYRQSLNNLILTDYLEFRWYVNGQHKLTARLAAADKSGKLTPNLEGIALAAQLFNEFYQTQVPTVGTPRDLAERMAQLAKLIRDLTFNALQAEAEKSGALHKQFKTFQECLLPNLKPVEFADIYAKTMAYGLFAARVNAPMNAPFSRSSAYQHLSANRFLRKLFLDVGEELENTLIAPFLDDIASLLAHADLAAILKDFGKRTRTEDPVVHFYETFLAAYDPKLRESRGVYYTPEPVVQFIVNSVDWLLRDRFDRPQGLADKEVCLLDPATGTSTFLYFVVRVIHDTLMSRKQGGAWQDYVRTELLPRLFGFELLVAPYVIAHLKLGLLLKDLGYAWGKDDRLRIYLTNALDEGVTRAETLGDLGWYISQEASEAAQVKKHTPIMVIVGNPPYSGHSANKGEWIGKLVRDYYFVDGQPLGERNPKWLQDDYVKFIRFAQWRIQQTGHGILAFITNHSYLDNPTFRGMRRHLLKTFDEIFVLDLHGNSKKKERTPEGGKDENVFDIQQGVAILLAVKAPLASKGSAQIHHAHLYGEREGKYAFLERNTIDSMEWTKLQPAAPFYFFAPQETKRRKEYERGWKITEAMPANSLGVTTARDEFAVAFERRTLERRIAELAGKSKTDSELLAEYGLHNTDSWNIAKSRTRLRRARQPEALSHYNYRPFDTRWTYHDSAILERDRSEVMSHLHNQKNLALVTLRRSRGQEPWNFAFLGEYPIDKSFITSLDNAFVFPLYLYPNGDLPPSLFDYENGRRPNLSDKFISDCSQKVALKFIPDGKGDLKKTFGPEDVFNYAYAVFHSPAYRQRYAEFLKIDFPRLPLTSDKKLFAKLAAKGAELVSLHLLKSPTRDDFITSYPVTGTNAVEKVKYEKKKVWINDAQYFGGVPESVWEFRVGGYQVCDKWLKDRKGRELNHDDVAHYQRIVVALKETIRIMAEIDRAIPAWPLK
jgi:predicted helicase